VATYESKQGIKAGKVLILGVALIESELIKPRVENSLWSSDQHTLTQLETYLL
jgi:hypothetical protein